MQVSAISSQESYGYILTRSVPIYNNSNDQINDTSFNSLTPYYTKKAASDKDLPQVYDQINEWKNFCHKQILGRKLNTIA